METTYTSNTMNSVSRFGNESGAQTGFFPILLSVTLNSN